MTKLLITRGISGSGKSTWARAFVAKDPENWVRSSRDDLRAQMYGTPNYDEVQEKAVSIAQNAMVQTLLEAGKNVLVDNTHLHPLDIANWRSLAEHTGASFKVKSFTISVEQAKANVSQRASAGGLFVSDEIIEAQYAKLIKFAS